MMFIVEGRRIGLNIKVLCYVFAFRESMFHRFERPLLDPFCVSRASAPPLL